jgi:hypothetical protein
MLLPAARSIHIESSHVTYRVPRPRTRSRNLDQSVAIGPADIERLRNELIELERNCDRSNALILEHLRAALAEGDRLRHDRTEEEEEPRPEAGYEDEDESWAHEPPQGPEPPHTLRWGTPPPPYTRTSGLRGDIGSALPPMYTEREPAGLASRRKTPVEPGEESINRQRLERLRHRLAALGHRLRTQLRPAVVRGLLLCVGIAIGVEEARHAA